MSITPVTSGSTQSDVVVSSGAANELIVNSGGTVISMTILSGGIALVSGTDSAGTIAAGGSETVFGAADGDTVAGTQLVSATGATVSNETVANGGAVDLFLKGTQATDLTIESGGALNINGNAPAIDTVIRGGTIDLQSPKATLSGSVTFSGGGTIEFTDISSAGFGDLAVISGFGAGDVVDETLIGSGATLSTTLSGGNTQAVVTSGGVTETLVFAGDVGADLHLQSDGIGGVEIVSAPPVSYSSVTSIGSGQTVSNVLVSGGIASALTVASGGTLVSGVIASGGIAVVSGADSGTTISLGGSETVLGSASGDTVHGTQLVSAATAAVSNETVANGGAIDLFLKGATASAIDVSSSGLLNISGNATATDTVLDGGIVELQSPKAVLAGSVDFESPSRIEITAVGSAGYGDLAVISGFTTGDSIDETTIGSGATLSTTTSGGNTIATVTSGGVSQSFTFSGSIASNLALQGDGGSGEAIVYTTGSSTIPTISAFTAGDLVIGISGDVDGNAYTDNQATPIALEEITPTDQVVGEMILPQTTTMVNGVTENAASGEYGSSSEGTLQLSADGQSLVIMGYGINAQTFNTGGAAVYGNASLAQSTSLLGGSYTPVSRVVADISYNGSVDTSTALYNIDDTNNPRSVATVDGTSFYISGQGVKGDTTQGVFLAQKGATEPTAIDTSTDTRTVEIYDGQLYVSRDSTQGTGGTSDIATYGGLPTSATTPSILPGIDGSLTLTAAEENSVNAGAVGSTVNLSPENYFFANATTLYIADGGNPKEGGVGDGGLQKWVYNGTSWQLQYTLSQGLNLVPDSSTSGTTGLIGLTGVVSGGTVELYATNSTLGDLDQTYLYSITDTLSATTPAPNESFTTLVTAAPDTNVRGISFAPSSATNVSGITDVASGSTVSNVVVSGGLTVEQGGNIVGADVLSGGSVVLSGTDFGSTIAAGGTETVLGFANADQISGTQIVSAATASVAQEDVYSGGALDLFLKGASATDSIVFSGGALNISGNATAIGTTISGGTVDLESAKAVLSGGLTFTGSGGTLELTAVSSSAGYGDLAVISGFAAGDAVDDQAIGAGATLSTTSSGGNTVATITSGGVSQSFTFAGDVTSNLQLTSDTLGNAELVFSGSVVSSGSQNIVSSGVTSQGLTVSGGVPNELIVQSGGTIVDTTIVSGGIALVSGTDTSATISAGGNETVFGSASGDAVYGTQLVSAATAVVSNETVYNGGAVDLFLKGAQGNDLTVLSGGALNINGNASATDTTVSGGITDLQSPKATLAGSVTFAGAGTIEFTDVSSAGYGDLAVISGFGAGDVVDEAVLGSGTTMSTTLSGGNTVATLTSGGTTETLIFAGDIGAGLVLQPDPASGVEIVSQTLPCYAAGTRIRTPHGEVAVEALAIGDLVVTLDGSAKPVRWIGSRRVACRTHRRPESVWPVRVAAHAFGKNRPCRDLLLSPDHAVHAEGVLIPVKLLINGSTVRQEKVARIEYFHIELDRHDVVLAENLPAETYLETGNRDAFANGGGAVQLHPDFGSDAEMGTLIWEARGYAPLTVTGPVLARVQATLAARAASVARRAVQSKKSASPSER